MRQGEEYRTNFNSHHECIIILLLIVYVDVLPSVPLRNVIVNGMLLSLVPDSRFGI